MAMLDCVSNPNARIGAPYFVIFPANASILIPDACAATVNWSNTVSYSDASIPASPIALLTNWTDVVASVLLIRANSRNFFVQFSAASPVNPNLVLTSPNVEPISSNSAENEDAIFL